MKHLTEETIKQTARINALAKLFREHGQHNRAYASDLIYVTSSLLLNNRPCFVVIRDMGVDFIDIANINSAQAKSKVSGDAPGVAEWWYGEPKYSESKGYEFVFTRTTADDAITAIELARKQPRG